MERAIQFVLKEQEPDGSWFGRWGVNYLYGTFLVLRGLEAMGIWNHEPAIQQAAEWIRMVQNTDGGWGETCGSYDDPNAAGHWAEHAVADGVGGAGAAGRGRYAVSDSVAKGIRWLIDRQEANGLVDGAGSGPQRRDRSTRERVSRGCSIWGITCIAITSRCWR